MKCVKHSRYIPGEERPGFLLPNPTEWDSVGAFFSNTKNSGGGMARGALSYQELIGLQEANFLAGFARNAFQPASVDLSITGEAYRLRGTILPQHGKSVRELLRSVTLFRQDLGQPLEVGPTYAIKVRDTVRLPKELYGYANPKSSTGRNDIQCRLLADGTASFDSVPAGFRGELWVLVSTRHFRLDETELRIEYEKHHFLYRPDGRPLEFDDITVSDHDGSLVLCIDLGTERVIGYRARLSGQAPVLVFSKRGHRVNDFWEPIERSKRREVLFEQERFYIYYTLDGVRVPPGFAAELVAMDARLGEFRSHYAGFIDSGWGYGRRGTEKGWPLVLEVRPFDDNLIVRHGQPIARIRYERVREIPSVVYGEREGSHYIRQRGAMLSKQFQPAK